MKKFFKIFLSICLAAVLALSALVGCGETENPGGNQGENPGGNQGENPGEIRGRTPAEIRGRIPAEVRAARRPSTTSRSFIST